MIRERPEPQELKATRESVELRARSVPEPRVAQDRKATKASRAERAVRAQKDRAATSDLKACKVTSATREARAFKES